MVRHANASFKSAIECQKRGIEWQGIWVFSRPIFYKAPSLAARVKLCPVSPRALFMGGGSNGRELINFASQADNGASAPVIGVRLAVPSWFDRERHEKGYGEPYPYRCMA